MPGMDAAKRGSGQQVFAHARNHEQSADSGRPWQWTCVLCDQVGFALTLRAAQNAIDSHQRHHPREAS